MCADLSKGWITFLSWGGWHVYDSSAILGKQVGSAVYQPSHIKKRIQYSLWMDFVTTYSPPEIKIVIKSGPLKGQWYLAKKESQLSRRTTQHGIDVAGAAFKTEENGSITEKTDPIVIYLYINKHFVKEYTFDLINQVDRNTEIKFLSKQSFAPGGGIFYEYLGFSPERYKQVFMVSRYGYYSIQNKPCEHMGHTFYDNYWMVRSGQTRSMVEELLIPEGIDPVDIEKTYNKGERGLMWYTQPNGNYFDTNKPTIIWIHGWPDVRLRDYPHFLYADRFLQKGYNVATYNWEEDILNIHFNYWPFPKLMNWKWVDSMSSMNWAIGAFIVTDWDARKEVLTKVWKPDGSGEVFRNALEGFFGQEALQELYKKEITLLGHSTAAQLISLGLRSFVENNNPLENLKFRVVFADPFFPSLTGALYPTAFVKHPYYDPGLAVDILRKVSDKGNPVIFICSSDVAGGEAVETLGWRMKEKATCVGLWPSEAAMANGYAAMREAQYPWGTNVAHPAGIKHWYAIDWYCELIDSEPPQAFDRNHNYLGRNVPSPNWKRTQFKVCEFFELLGDYLNFTYTPDDDTFKEYNWLGRDL